MTLFFAFRAATSPFVAFTKFPTSCTTSSLSPEILRMVFRLSKPSGPLVGLESIMSLMFCPFSFSFTAFVPSSSMRSKLSRRLSSSSIFVRSTFWVKTSVSMPPFASISCELKINLSSSLLPTSLVPSNFRSNGLSKSLALSPNFTPFISFAL